jgi:hypothetical protein
MTHRFYLIVPGVNGSGKSWHHATECRQLSAV